MSEKKEHGWLGIKTLFKRTLLDLEVDIWFRVATELTSYALL